MITFALYMTFKTIYLSQTDSTNRWAKEHGGDGDDLLVWTDFQTAGRGCGTNTWESAPGQNLLFSALLHPKGVAAADQFILSMANALALKAAADSLTDGITVKWPNDIYWHDRKLAGTLIETTLSGNAVKTCIIGTGLNVNQATFHSDAPNPVSLRQILGHETDRAQLLNSIVCHLTDYMHMVERQEWAAIRQQYRDALYRKDGRKHPFCLPGGEQIDCELSTVGDDGTLVLIHNGQQRCFGFKEVQFLLPRQMHAPD